MNYNNQSQNYLLPDWIQNIRLNLLKSNIEGIFGKEKEKQEALQSWF